MRQVLLKITVLLALTGFVNISKALTPADSLGDRQAAAITKSLVTRIKENERLIKTGKADQANYVIYNDDPSVFMSFTSGSARKLWIDKGIIGDLFSGEKSNEAPTMIGFMNNWVNGLKKSFLDNTIYKDYKIYFVVSGIYNYTNINAKEPDYDWSDVRQLSFHDKVKDEGGTINYTEDEQKIIQSAFAKVQLDPDNKELTPLLRKGKYIVFFIFNFYRNHQNIIAPYKAGMERSEEGIKLHTYSAPDIFQVNGHFASDETTRQLAREIEVYNNQHQIPDATAIKETIGERNDYLSQLIRNVFAFFATKTNGGLANMDCKSTDLRDRLYQLYQTPLADASTSIAETLKEFPFETRKCLLEQISTTRFCGDGTANLVAPNFCENLIMELVKTTPVEQRKQLLQFFNSDNKAIQLIIGNVNDVNELLGVKQGGGEHFTELVQILGQYAFEAYKDDPSIAKDPSDPCQWYLYDPKTKFNDWSKNVKADYNKDNTIDFEFRNYRSICFDIPQINYNGTATSYVPLKFRKKPFEFIGIIPTIDLPFKFKINGEEQYTKGEQILIPALLLYWNISKTTTTDAKDGLEFALKMAGYFKAADFFKLVAPKLAKTYSTVSSILSNASEVAERTKVKEKEKGSKLSETIDALKLHYEAGKAITNKDIDKVFTFETILKIYDVARYWREYKAVEHNYLDPDFQSLNVQMSDLEELLYENQLLSKDEIYAKENAIDVTFPAIRTEADYLAFRQFCVYDTRTTVDVAEGRWTDSVALWRKTYGISARKNIALMKFGENHFLLPSSADYSTQMQNSTRFVPADFYNNYLKTGKRVFDVPKVFDSEAIGLEYFAYLQKAVKGGKYAGVSDEITIFSDLWTCPSCANLFGQFRKMFPNVTFKVITNPKLHY